MWGQVWVRGLQNIALVVAVFLYACFGSPTPDHPGALELVIGVLLVLSAGIGGLWAVFQFKGEMPGWFRAGQVLLIFGLSVPVIGGVVAGQAPAVMMRDVLPFVFMMMPVFLVGQMRLLPVLAAVMVLGLVFSLRAYFDLPMLASGEALFYLANSPAVLFSATAFAGMGVAVFVERFSLPGLVRAGACLVLSVVCLLPMVEAQQRAGLGMVVACVVFVLGLYIWRFPRRGVLALVLIAVAGLAYTGALLGVFENLSHKTALVGVNMRAEEWAAVWRDVSGDPFSLLFGRGWGAQFASPAVAGITVNYTHGLASSLLLKTGVAGLGLGLMYIFLLLERLWLCLRPFPALTVALAGSVLIDVFLYASFKSLDFGLVLLLAAVLIRVRVFYGEDRADDVASGRGVLYSKGVA